VPKRDSKRAQVDPVAPSDPALAGPTAADSLDLFHPAVRDWFSAVFPGPTRPQILGWPAIARGESTLVFSPTGSGKTLAAFLWCINRLMFCIAMPPDEARCRVIYISPIKALAVDVERNLRAPLVGIAQAAQRLGHEFHEPTIAIRTGDTPPSERARFLRHPSDILITTPESLYLLLTSQPRELLRSVDTVILDEIHAIVPTKRGSHLSLSLERLERIAGRRLQRIGLSATQRPLEEVARFLGGAEAPTLAAKPAQFQNDTAAATATLPEPPRKLPDDVIPSEARTSAPSRVSSAMNLLSDVAKERELHGPSPSATKLNTESDSTTPDQPLSEFESSLYVPVYRPITIIDAGEPKRLDLRVEVPVEDMARLDDIEPLPSGPASQGPVRPSIWSAIHPKLLELIRSHRSTLIFVNNRRLAERISGAINDLAQEVLVRAHHGSVAVAQRKEIEDRLKLGTIRGLVATSSLELGIDMGAIDLVIQIESPPSVASGMQRVGRASHNVGAVSNAVIFPKYRADLVACAAITKAMYEGQVESVHYPRNPLDVLAQQIVAIVSFDEWTVDDLFQLVRSSAPYAGLTRSVFESLLDMLAGRYPSDEFAELRPRITWDRVSNRLTPRQSSRRVAIINGGTIPDRGLYGVFLSGATKGARVGELDEEMVFESRTGDTIILGATTWRINEISHDRVVVSPAPGEPGKMPFWHGDTAGRPAEFGRKIGAMTRELLAQPRPVAFSTLVTNHSLDANAAENLLRFLEDQAVATDRVPSDQDIVIETCRDELGDRRICVLTPFGTRVHAPWCMAVTAKLRAERSLEIESMWSDDGFVLRIPDSDEEIASDELLPNPIEFQQLVLQQLGSTSLFAAKFREAASRALLLPRRRAGMRTPLWQQRKRAADLLAVAARFSSFPILLETYRECIRDVFDLPATSNILSAIQRGEIRVTSVTSDKPSPFASSLLFSYVANYIYDGDAPLAERRAQALSIDQSQLQEILGDTDLRELLDQNAIDEVESRLQSLDPEYQARHADGVHDLLLKHGDLTESEIAARSASPAIASTINDLATARRAVRVRIAGESRFIPVEYASRYRDALGTPLPPGLAEVFLAPTDDPLREIIRRYTRTHGPFTTQELAARYALQPAQIDAALHSLHAKGKLLEGEFRPHGQHQEWCDPEILQQIRRKSLARLRREVEPVEQRTFARFTARWQGVATRRRGLDALLDAVENLQGAALLVSELEREILPARISDYRTADLDAVMSAGEVVWVGLEQVGDRDGRVALYLTEALPALLPPFEIQTDAPQLSEKAEKILEVLKKQGASFFTGIHSALGGGYPGEVREALWQLVWSGKITNDTFFPLRDLLRPSDPKQEREHRREVAQGPPGSPEYLRQLRSRKSGGGPAHGRWSLVSAHQSDQAQPISITQWSANIAQQLLTRHGIVMRETAIAENIPRGYNTIYPALKTMEESGIVRRGMFVAGMGAAQFAATSAVDMLRSLRTEPPKPETIFLAASDPANPYGTLLPWPRGENGENEPNQSTDATTSNSDESQSQKSQKSAVTKSQDSRARPHTMSRTKGAGIILINGVLAAFLRRRNLAIQIFLPENEPERTQFARELAKKLAELAIRRQGRRSGLLISEINATPAREHFLARFLEESCFTPSAFGYQMRRITPLVAPQDETNTSETDAASEAEAIDADSDDLSESA
jgi:ATP-dependent Lhr-like helicase